VNPKPYTTFPLEQTKLAKDLGNASWLAWWAQVHSSDTLPCGFRVQGLAFAAWVLEFRVYGLGIGLRKGSGGRGVRVQGLGVTVWGSGFGLGA
jgi:hypothetical protein